MPYKGAEEYPMLLCLWHFGGTDMKSEKTKDMSIYIYLMYIMEDCKEINEIVKDDLNAAKKYICSNLDLDIKNVAYDAK
jgi:hypothetical protein